MVKSKKHENHTLSTDIDNEVKEIIKKELERQKNQLILIASENFTSQEVIRTMGSILTNKYAEGYPGFRYYAGCEHIDEIEQLAINRANQLFGSNYSNVQPHSGVSANLAVYLSVLNCGDRILSMNLRDGGHLSHGHKQNLSGRYYEIHTYTVDPETEMIDYENVRKLAKATRPKLIIAGASSYSRLIDFNKFRDIADEVGAYLLADTAHIAGLMVTGHHPSSINVADFTTATTHKTLRGPRGGLVIADKKYAGLIDKSVFPGVQGGPMMHIIAAKAVAFREALKDSFKDYSRRIIENSKALCEYIKNEGFRIVSGGTDNHLFLIDLTSKELTGYEAVGTLSSVGIIINKNVIPFDKLDPIITSGIRIGTPAVTTQGMGVEEMYKIGELISSALKNRKNNTKLKEIGKKVKNLAGDFPVYTK
ncbi:MAG: serine hydroxymethyltransferase [Actinobacteria bacterium]|nr:serine hydroxymethyltransferase [Actinomycetota bacterium]MBL7123448.1 serine hydroxymethyltransferase [Actinomycetota bacterium]